MLVAFDPSFHKFRGTPETFRMIADPRLIFLLIILEHGNAPL